MAAHIITPESGTSLRWTLAEVYLTDGSHLSLVEELTSFVVKVKHPQREVRTCTFPLMAKDHTDRVLPADHAEALASRLNCFEAALQYFQQALQVPGVRYPSPTPVKQVNGQWIAQVQPGRRGSPYLALAWAGRNAEHWVLLESGRCWCLGQPNDYLTELAQQLRGYGRLMLQLDSAQQEVTNVGPGNRWIHHVQDLPRHLRQAA